MHIFCNKNNFILINIYNYKKTVFEFNKTCVFNRNNIKFWSKNNNNFITVNFNLNNFLKERDNIISFLKQENIFFDLLLIRYNYKNYSLDFFENFFNNMNKFNVYEDIFIFSNKILFEKINKRILYIFLLFSIVSSINNLKKCLLFIKQLQS